MSDNKIVKKRVLFSGYAPVHFACFHEAYKVLAADDRIDMFLSGGFRHVDKDTDETTFSLEGFYEPFGVDMSKVIPIEQAWEEDFDVLICGHLSDALFPRSATRTVQVFHGVSFKNLAVRDKALRFDTLCLPGEYHAEKYREQGLIREGNTKYYITGFAKTDSLVNDTLDRDKFLKDLGLDPALPTILFAPTGDKKNAMESMGEKVIKEVSDAGKWNLLVKPHDHPKNKINWFEELDHFVSDRVKLVRDFDVTPYLHCADLLITDASSVSVEYTLMDRPIIYLDIPKLMEKIKKRAVALDLSSRDTGVIVDRKADIVSAVEDSLAHKDRESEKRHELSSKVFYKPGSAAERVAGVILNEAGVEEKLPEDVIEVKP